MKYDIPTAIAVWEHVIKLIDEHVMSTEDIRLTAEASIATLENLAPDEYTVPMLTPIESDSGHSIMETFRTLVEEMANEHPPGFDPEGLTVTLRGEGGKPVVLEYEGEKE